MSIRNALLAAAFFASFLAVPALSFDDGSDEDADQLCAGCAFSSPNPVNGGVPGPCATDLRVRVFGASGACYQEEVLGPCVARIPCRGGFKVEYKSLCDVAGGLASGGIVLVGPLNGTATGGAWKTILDVPATDIACGTPTFNFTFALMDSSGNIVTSGFQITCTSCVN